MDDTRVGRSLRAVRIRKGWRQEDVARQAGVSQNAVSRAERGLIDGMTLSSIRAIGQAVGVLIDLEPRWRCGELDRLLGARHSALHEAVASRFAALPGWTAVPEVTFSEFGERGAIDVLAWHAPTRTLLIIELKTELIDVQELLGTLDRKRRLARKVAADRGWVAAAVGVWVILAEHRTNRRRVDAHRTVLRAALPTDGRTMNAWLLAPRGTIAALSFWPRSDGTPGSRALAPVRRVRVAATAAQSVPSPEDLATQR